MGLLDHLWDDTVAGPPPESGLGKFFSSSSSTATAAGGAAGGLQVTRSITIIRPAPSPSSSASSSPRSPSLSPANDQASLFAPRTPRGSWRRPRRKTAAEEMDAAEPRVVIGSLDR